MKARKAWLAVVVIALAAAGGFFIWTRAHKREPPRYETVKVDRGRIQARVTATGTVSALVTVLVGSQVSGRIQQLFVDFNSIVKKGQIIGRIDPELFNAAVEQARANYAAAAGDLEKAKAQSIDAARQYERARTLAERKLIAIADRDTAESTALAAKAQVAASQGALEQARAGLHQAQVNLDYSIIKSPIDGVVISRTVDVGQTVAASLAAPTLFTIAEDLRKMQVDTSVAEADVGKLKPDMDATFTVDAYPQERFHGSVRQIRNSPQTVQSVVTYDAVIDVDNPDLKLKPGMTANCSFTYARRDDTLRVPNAALRFRPPEEMAAALGTPAPLAGSGVAASAVASAGEAPPSAPAASGSAEPGAGRMPRTAQAGGADRPRGSGRRNMGGGREETNVRTVWVLDGDKPRPVSIRVGISDGTLTEVAEGSLNPGDALLTDVISSPGSDAAKGAPALGGATQLPGMRRLF
jgi:HlyD family secretion protein